MSLTINGSGGGTPVGTPRVEVGEYTGDGAYGSTHTMSLTFSGTPLYVRIRAGTGNGDFFPTIPAGMSNYYFSNKTDGYGLTVTLDGNTMTWRSGYTNSTATYAELNVNAVKYRYMALVI